jgi:outer membrane protein OmpA-like peptidoglycan-associated protein
LKIRSLSGLTGSNPAGGILEGVMALLFATFVNGQIMLGMVKARPCVDTPDTTIDGFPEFAFTVETINDPQVKEKLRELARRIVESHKTMDKIIGFEVHGHADVTLRIPPGEERDRTEVEVSRDRAENARNLLLQMIEEQGGKPIMTGIRANTSTVAVGSKCRKVVPAHTEAEMKRNRRVEIFLKVMRAVPVRPEPPPPQPQPKPKQQPPPELGHNWKVKIKSGSIDNVSSPFGEILAASRITLNLVITDLDRHLQADFTAKAEGLTVSGSVLPSFLPGGGNSTSIAEGPEVHFSTRPMAILSSFAGSINLGQDPGAGASLLSGGGKFPLTFTSSILQPHPAPLTLSGGNDPTTMPGLSLGIARSEGTLTMTSTPVPVR